MKTPPRFLLLAAFAWQAAAVAAEVDSRVIDGLNRPVEGVSVRLTWSAEVGKGRFERGELMRLTTDRAGRIKASYDEKKLPDGTSISAELSKAGYHGFSTGLDPEWRLLRLYTEADVLRAAALRGDAQAQAVRELLAGANGLQGLDFLHDRKFRPALRALVTDPIVGVAAGVCLSEIAVPEDVRWFLQHAPKPAKSVFDNGWAYPAAAALLEPTTEAEWGFLRNCLRFRYGVPAYDAAVQSLQLMASAESRRWLEEFRREAGDDRTAFDAALRYIESKPQPIADQSLPRAIQKVAGIVREGVYEGHEPPLLNSDSDKARVDLNLLTAGCIVTYLAVFHKVDSEWKLRSLRAVRYTMLRPADPAGPKRAEEK